MEQRYPAPGVRLPDTGRRLPVAFLNIFFTFAQPDRGISSSRPDSYRELSGG